MRLNDSWLVTTFLTSSRPACGRPSLCRRPGEVGQRARQEPSCVACSPPLPPIRPPASSEGPGRRPSAAPLAAFRCPGSRTGTGGLGADHRRTWARCGCAGAAGRCLTVRWFSQPRPDCPAPAHNPVSATDAYLSMAAGHLPNRMELGSCRGWVLAWKQPRAVDAGKRGLGQPARHNASAATGAARGCTRPNSHRA
jgi:hypothetical protein